MGARTKYNQALGQAVYRALISSSIVAFIDSFLNDSKIFFIYNKLVTPNACENAISKLKEVEMIFWASGTS